jgi:TIR domain
MPQKRVFICYKDQDAPFAAGRIAEFLKSRLGEANVFRYIESVGTSFDHVKNRLFDSDVALVVIGKEWRTEAADGRMWMKDPNDFLRLEIEYAFGRFLPVLPVLIENASLGHPDDYPDSLKPLTRVIPIRVSDRNFDRDAETLLDVIQRSESMPVPLPSPGQKVTAEDLVLIWRSWRSPEHDYMNSGSGPVYRFDVVIGAPPEILDRIDRVVYYLPPAWATSPTLVRDREGAFPLKEVAWWDLTVRARVYIAEQSDVIPLSTHVWLWHPDRI